MSVSSVLQNSATFGNPHAMASNQQYLMARPAYRFKPSVTVTVSQDGPEGLYGRRLRKNLSQVRRTADHASTVLNFLQARVWQKNFKAKPIVQPDILYSSEILPPAYEKDKPIDCVTTKFLRAAMNKVKCPIYSICWTPEGRRLITGASSGEFTLWNGIAFNFETILQAHDVAVRSMVWSHNDQWMVTADHDGFIKYWQANMNNVKMFQAHKEAIRAISFCPTDTKFATASDDGTVRVWDFIRCHEERILRGHGSDVRSVHWHPQKGLIVSGSRDSQQPVKLWDPKSGQCLATLHDHKNGVMDVKWNDNGNWLISGSRDHLIKLYDIRMMKEMQTLRGHKKEVTSLAWHPINEGLFVSGGGDGSMMFWFVGSEKEVGEIECAHEQAIWTLAWHPLGHICASGSNDNNTKFWTRNKPGDTLEDFYGMGAGQYDQPAESHAPVPKPVVQTSSSQEGESVSSQGVHIPGMGLEGDLLDKIKGVGNSGERKESAYNNAVRQAAFSTKRNQRQFERVWAVNKPPSDLDMRRGENGHSEQMGGELKREAQPPFPAPPFFPVGMAGNRPNFPGFPVPPQQPFGQMGVRVPFNGPLNVQMQLRPNFGGPPDSFGMSANFLPPGFNPTGPPPFGMNQQRFSPPMRMDFPPMNSGGSADVRHPGNFGAGRMPPDINVGNPQNWGAAEPLANTNDPRISRDSDFRRNESQPHSDPRMSAGSGLQGDVDLRVRPDTFSNQDYRGGSDGSQPSRDPRMRPRQEQNDWQGGWSGSDVTPWPVAANSAGRPEAAWPDQRQISKQDSWPGEAWSEDQRRRDAEKWSDEYSQDGNGPGGNLGDSPSSAHLNPKRKWQQEYEAQQGGGPDDVPFAMEEEDDSAEGRFDHHRPMRRMSHDKRSEFKIHRCVFENDIKGLLQNLKNGVLSQKDVHGNTPLHLAVMLGHKECVAVLLSHNAPVKVKNSQGWSPLAEAISYGDRQIITSLLRKLKTQSRESIRNRKSHLIEALKQLGDFYLELKWDFHCWIPLVSKILPSDICKIYKKGTCLRLNTSLVDFNERSWERGDISFLFDSSAEAADSLVILDNKSKVFQKIKYEESEAEIEDEVDILMSSDIVNAQMSTKSIAFSRAQTGWFFREDKTETVGSGYVADFFYIDGLLLSTRKRREHLSAEDIAKNKAIIDSLQKGNVGNDFDVKPPPRRKSLPPPAKPTISWREYISAEGGPPPLGRQLILKQNLRHFKCTLAMSKDFPLAIEQLLNILEIIAPFKHLRKLRDFCQMKLPPGFPVRIEIPILPTVSAKITFQKLEFVNDLSDSQFKIPKNYHEDSNRFPDL